MIRLELRPHIEKHLGCHIDRFDAFADSELFCVSRQPLHDGARKLLALGRSPGTMLVMRHAGKSYDSFEPSPIGELAKWTIVDSDKQGLQRRRWQPFDASRFHPVHARTGDDE